MAATNARVRLHVEDTGGAGRPVILIHGWPLSAEAWKDQVGPLQQAGYRVIAYDRRGFGRSEKPADGYEYDTLADDLAGIIEDKQLREAVLVGFSMGGGEVARYVARHGTEKLAAVVFASAVPPYMLKTDDNPEGPLSKEQALEQGLKASRETFFDDFTRGFFSARDRAACCTAMPTRPCRTRVRASAPAEGCAAWLQHQSCRGGGSWPSWADRWHATRCRRSRRGAATTQLGNR
ncbi:alpha/beta hydrolase [Pantoea ananatis]|uniref:alpha/beta fold hydrolase n=1 Tax=Pantoea ananas TaxID=553 RepID=UPI00221E8E70|nr:alpha/beta hydrolase [Pantoea ananatis]